MAKVTRRIKKVIQRPKGLPKKTRKVLRKTVTKKRIKSPKISKAIPPKDMGVEQAKYFTHPQSIATATATLEQHGSRLQKSDLPKKYDKDVIVLQVRDPWWLHAYWEVRDRTYRKFRNELLGKFDSAKKVLRVYDVSFIDFNGTNAHRFFDLELNTEADNWYIDTAGPGRSWCVDLGLKLADGRFITIVRSNTVTTPLDGPSWISDEEWMVPDELFTKLYATAAGLGGSPVKLKKPWLELQRRSFGSGGIFSVGFSPAKKKEKRSFWLAVNTELIVYGATEPGARVTIGGNAIALRSDGTFSLRFSLPNGRQVIPVKAISCDGIDERTITPVVTKETK